VLAGSDVVFYLDAPALGVACERPGDREGVRVALKLDTGQAEVILHGAGVGAGA
jgi:hypothetical protein